MRYFTNVKQMLISLMLAMNICRCTTQLETASWKFLTAKFLFFFHLQSENKNVTVAIPYVYSNNPNPCAAGCKLKADIAVPA